MNDDTDVYLMLIDFKAEEATHKPLQEVRNVIKLRYPTLVKDASYDTFEISSDPAPGWKPGPDDRTPFFVAKENRIFPLSIHIITGDRELAFCHFIPLSTFQKCLDRPNTSVRQEMQWSEWAPRNTRLIQLMVLPLPAWPCCIFGSRFITSTVIRRVGQVNLIGSRVYDFNQLALRVRDSEPRANCKCILQSEVPGEQVWEEEVETSLPYRCFSGTLPVEALPTHKCLMCTADHIVVVDVSASIFLISTNINDVEFRNREKNT